MKNRFTVPIPLPHEADGLVSLFVGFHGTNKSGLLAILCTGTRQLTPGPASGHGNYVFVKGFSAYSTISEDARKSNSEEARHILTRIREKSSKHACGVIIEVSMWEIHKPCKDIAEGIGEDNHIASHGSLPRLARDGLCPRRTPLSVRCRWILITQS